MGNYRFRLSDMIPNAWFYKLKDMSRGRKQCNSHSFKKKTSSSTTTISQKSNISQPRYTYYFTAEQPNRPNKFYNSPINTKASDTHFPDSPRRSSSFSSKKRSKRKTIYKPSPKLVSSFSVWSSTNSIDQSHSPDYYYSSSPLESSPESLVSETEEVDFGFLPNYSFDQQVASCSSSNCNCKLGSSSSTDIIIDVNGESFKSKTKKIDGFDSISEAELPPILTKPRNFKRSSKLEEIKANESLSVKIVKEERISTHKEKRSPSSVGIRLRTNSPRIASKKIQACARKSLSRNKTLSESFAVVKSSIDPQKDFKDSMVEMIVENNIQASKDLEDLLACYLTLNSKEYHELIIKAFEQIWFDMTDLRL